MKIRRAKVARTTTALLFCLMLSAIGAASASATTGAMSNGVLVPLTGGQAEPEPVFTGAFGTALLNYDLDTDEVSVQVQVFGIDKADLLNIGAVGPFHLHIESPDPPTDQVGPVALSFGMDCDWTQQIGGITLNAVGQNVGTFSAAEIRDALTNGTAYFNLHTQDYPSGELRGDIPAIVPEPGTAMLFGLGLVGLGWAGKPRGVWAA